MKRFLFIISAISLLLASCDDSTDTLGGSITDISDNMEFDTNEIYIASESVKGDPDAINARSSYAYLGQMYDDETFSNIKADFMTQVVPLVNQYLQSYNRVSLFAHIDSIMVFDDNGTLLPIGKDLDEETRAKKMQYLKADSCMLTFYVSSHQGDSLAQMSLCVRELKEPYSETEEYSISFDPEAKGLLRTDAGSLNETRTYSIKNMVAEGLKKTSSSSSHYISIPLNREYKSRDGETYSNYGTYLMKQYLDENANYHYGYNNQTTFLEQLSPGFFLKHIGGEGAMSKITATTLTTYYRAKFPNSAKPDSIHRLTAVFSGTEESIQHSTINDDGIDNLIERSKVNDFTYVKSPNAIYTQLTLNILDIMEGHESDSLSTVRIFVPRLNKESDSEYTFSAPSTLLLLPTDSIKNFFEKKQVTNGRTSYVASFSSSVNGYTFGNISSLINTTWRGDYIQEYSEIKSEWSAIEKEWKESGSSLSIYDYFTSLGKYSGWMDLYSQWDKIKQEWDSIVKEWEESHSTLTLTEYAYNNHTTWMTLHQWNKNYSFVGYTLSTKKDVFMKIMLIPVEISYSTMGSAKLLNKVSHSMALESSRLRKSYNSGDKSSDKNYGAIRASIIYTRYKE
ncbi:MAG: DUF4270 domain-containing protein [Prevotella sp.]|nr:DUF4270 domain-containing protein [Prevotella sp.]